MQRYLLLITPVITTKPASSDLISRAPVEKSIQVKPRCTSSPHLWALLENLPSWILPWVILMVMKISQTPLCTYLFSLISSDSYTPSLLSPLPQLPCSSPPCCMEHSELPAFSLLCPTRFSPCLDCLYHLLAWLIPLCVYGGSQVPPKFLPLWF